TVVVAASAFVAAGVGLATRGSSDASLTVVAHFDDASPLLEGNDVRSHGVKVGTISSIEIDGRDALVTLELDEGALPVHEDAKVTTRPVSLLGERYVELDSGTPGAEVMRDGGEIGVASTGSSVGLDEVLNTLDQPTSASLGLLVNALGVGLDKNGANARDAISALLPALTRTSELTSVLRDQNDTLGALVDSLEPVAGGLAADEGRALDELVASSQQMLAATARNDVAFRAMLAQLPATIAAARTTLGKLEGAANATTPTLAKLRPTTRTLSDLSQELEAFGDAADPALRSAVPVLEQARLLLQEARPVAAALRAAGPALRSSSTSLQPISRDLAGRFTAVMEFFKGWALTTNGKDGLSHYFRGGLVLTPYAATGLLPGSTPSVPGAKQAPTSGLGNVLDDLLPELPGGLLSSLTDSDGGVTGLNVLQELDAIQFLLGGN
ncbi:MAG TPA: MlaD family protein, partial [Nocardioidaceae bacterium]|nr:MlaD family protein [Nocardioidaceae bacterium]